MTPEKTAKEIVDRFDDTAGHTKLAAAIAEAIAAEREACAKVAEDDTSFMMLQDFGMQSTCTQVRENIASAIRNRAIQNKE